jgi:hypothetical protein
MKTSYLALLLFVSCNPSQDAEVVKKEIQAQLNKCVQAVNTKDIELYMDQIPHDFVIYDEGGEVITREKQRAFVLRDWAIIDTTLSNEFNVDSLRLMGDSAIVFTSQRWERMMFRPVKELGGEIYINGLRYEQE